MRDEIFEITVNHKGQPHVFTIKTDLPVGPEPFGADYDVYRGRKHLYTLNHCKNEDEVHCWEIKKRAPNDGDPDLAEAIGLAIDDYFS